MPTADLCHHRLLPQGQVRSAVELRLGVRLDVQHQLGRLRQRPDARTVARPDRILALTAATASASGAPSATLAPADTVSPNDSRVNNRAISQVNLFWHHKFCCSAPTVGCGSAFPTTAGSNRPRAAALAIGRSAPACRCRCPARLALYANGSYMHPSASAGRRAANRSLLGRQHGRCVVLRRQRPKPRHQRQVLRRRTCRWPTTATSWSTSSVAIVAVRRAFARSVELRGRTLLAVQPPGRQCLVRCRPGVLS